MALGDIKATLDALAAAIGAPAFCRSASGAAECGWRWKRSIHLTGKTPGATLSSSGIVAVSSIRRRMSITEGFSEDAIVQDMAVCLGFRDVHFSPRGGGKESNS